MRDWVVTYKSTLHSFENHFFGSRTFSIVSWQCPPIHTGHDHTLNCHRSSWGSPHPWSVKTARKARHSYLMKFLLVELSQLRSSVDRAPARKAEDLGFDSRAGHTLFTWIWLFIASRRVIEKVVDNWRGKHLNRLAWLVRPSALALPQIGQSSSILFGEFHHHDYKC